MGRLLLALVVLSSLAIVPSSGLAAMTRTDLAPVASAEAPIAAYGGWVVWSERGLDRLYRLVAFHDGAKQELTAVAPRPVPFDVDIGPDALGRPQATFSRCVNEQVHPLRCRLRSLALLGGAEIGLPVPRSDKASDQLPSRWGNRVAFERLLEPAAASELMLYDIRTHRVKRLRHGSVPDRRTTAGRATAIDLGPETVAYSWSSWSRTQGPGPWTEVRAQSTRNGRQLRNNPIDPADGRFCGTSEPRSPNAVTRGAFFLNYLAGCDAEEGELALLDLNRKATENLGPLADVRRIARDATDGTVYLVMGQEGAMRLVRMDAPPPLVTAL